MSNKLEKMISDWLFSDVEGNLLTIYESLDFFSRKLYDDYEPSQFTRFLDRLYLWLTNVEDDIDRKVLFQLLSRLFFVGRREFEALCRAAYHGDISRWTIDHVGIDITSPDAVDHLEKENATTWFCPITDSMRINAFLKVNSLAGHKFQPDWASLAKFGDAKKIREYVNSNGIKRLVLLEDFVGTGTQMRSAVRYAAQNLYELPVLCCPLILCPRGMDVAIELEEVHQNLSIRPVLTLPESSFVKPAPQPDEEAIYALVRNLTLKVASRFSDECQGDEAFGFNETGALVVMYSNCPNNTLPIVHNNNSEAWRPLFPRLKRR